MDFDEITAVLAAYPGTRLIEAAGDAYAIHDPDHDYEQRPRQGWATVVASDAHDTASDLDHPGRYRLNIGLPKARFAELFPGGTDHDPAAADVLFPHPVYGAYHWVAVITPDTTWPQVRGLLDEAHAFAVRRHANAARRERDRPVTP
ncbi:DUF6194 family protein [Pseudonocardia sp. HH130630-07]|uniref:DUF6194 family protein n=1 Tax=Pseudonocardia sp. HH130630-07 TaxID=1690815 RepID=UPI00081520DD|nr:DUF6194 family protein [Pseudonocardia sp. HH130630-07]ANY06591.1 hypothetical protein AFB00_10135 [Pseudonocardia sp. HH130630-07]